jgi:predicted outer membrane repeat protein
MLSRDSRYECLFGVAGDIKKLAAVFIFMLLVLPCAADIIIVKDDGSGDYTTIQAAVDVAVNGDIIEIQPGIYTGDGNRDIDFKGKAITVRSAANNPDIVNATIIDCNGTQAEPHRGFYFHNNEGANSILNGLTITNGCNRRGAAIYCYYAGPTITNCNITGNTAYYVNSSDGGAGIYLASGASLIKNCRFTNNTAKDAADGGAIQCRFQPSSPTISNCTFSGNSADRGGAIYNCDGPIIDCTIVGNSAVCGGGLHSCDGPIINCTISGNSGDWTGGLDWCRGPIENCIISGNSAKIYGGSGLGWCDTTITNCIITGNYAARWGGGLYDCNCTLINCVIQGNSAGESGGGICCRIGKTAEVVNSVIWNNDAALGPQIALALNGSNIYLNYCDVEGGKSAVYVYDECTLYWGTGNIDTDPCFVSPGFWEQNGTPDYLYDDFWIDGNYHLKSQAGRWDANSQSWAIDANTSPCIDMGDWETPVGSEPFPNGGRINMGAYGGTAEASKSYFGKPPCKTIIAGDINGDCKVDFVDFAIMAIHWQEEKYN